MIGRTIHAGVDMTGVYVTQAGIARYCRGLWRGLERVAPKDVTWTEISWPVENFAYKQPQRAIKTVYRELIWGKLIAPGQIKRAGCDLLHSTSSLFIRVPRGVKHIVGLHDLSISRHPERFRPWQVRAWKRRLPVIGSGDRVLTISRFTADEAIRMLGLDARKISVVHNGCDFHPDEITIQEHKPDFAVPDEFFLFVGSLEPGKNLKLLKQAYLQAEQQGQPAPPLLIVGARWEGVASEGEHPKNWHYLGRQSDEVLVYLYRRALALLFPSIYEGFGLPIIEAMALGCPAVCSPVSSLPEVGGEGAYFVEMEPAKYLAAMRELRSNPRLREEWIARGRAWSSRFSWTRCAKETLDVYRDVMRA